MSVLVAKGELESVLGALAITNYYVEVDMNGALTLVLSPELSGQVETIFARIEQIDKLRKPDDIYKVSDVFYPLKRIRIDEDDDAETLEHFKRKDFIPPYYSQHLNVWFKPAEKPANLPPCVTFYSYKGGVGRSTALAIVARLLAKMGLTVAVIDLDLEAPGINSLLLTKAKPAPFGVVDYLYHAPWIRDQFNEKRFNLQYMVREEVLRLNDKPGQLYVMTAGGTDVVFSQNQVSLLLDEDKVELVLEPHYLQKLSYTDFDVFARSNTNNFQYLLEDVAKYSKADIILLDARTGLSNVSGTLIQQFSDVLSVHIQDNRQNREGIKMILEAIPPEKVQNIIWSNSKVVFKGKDSMIEKFILSAIHSSENMDEDVALNLSYLSYISELEDISAYDLKLMIDRDQIPLGYKDLVNQVVSLTGVGKRFVNYFSEVEAKVIIGDFRRMIKNNVETPYISQRFLDEDLELFVGFPGSGKSTFKQYMNKKYSKEIKGVDFEEFVSMDKSPHNILTHVAFLDWNYEEATQAVCKWFLQSNEFVKWLCCENRLSDGLGQYDLEIIRSESEYELPEKVALEIMSFIFSGVGWERIFKRLQHRDLYVLPADLFEGVKEIVRWNEYKRELQSIKHGVRVLFPDYRVLPISSNRWVKIGQKKAKWLETYDPKILSLVSAYHRVVVERDYEQTKSTQELFESMKKAYGKIEDINTFDLVLDKANKIGMFIYTDNAFPRLAPIYRFIRFD